MNQLTSFGALLAVAIGLVFVMPESPASFIGANLELQNPLSQLAGTSAGVKQNVDSSSGAGGVDESQSGQTGGGDGTKLDNPIKPASVQEFISILIKELVKVGYVVGVVFIVYAGFLFVTGGESDAKRTKAKNTLLWTVIGIGILLGAQAIAIIVSTTISAISNSAQ